MTDYTPTMARIAVQLSAAYEAHDLDRLAPLLAEDVTWGDAEQPRGCRNRSDVLGTFSRLMDLGVNGKVTEMSVGTEGILCGLEVHFPAGHERGDEAVVYHVYRVREGQIAAIERFDERELAADLAGVRA